MRRKIKIYKGVSKCVCCSLINLTIGCRIIAIIGLMVSLWLVIAFANDKFLNSESNYDVSRKTATALGLEWRHFHHEASIKHDHDPEGKMISITVIFYSFTFLGVNLLLFIASLRYDWCFALPWLVFEAICCLSKLGSLVFHLQEDLNVMESAYFIGFILNVVLSVWWWIVVLFAVISWKNQQNFDLETEMFSLYSSNVRNNITETTTDSSTSERIHIYGETCNTTISPVKESKRNNV
ncbi:uncharacterized protein [Diabrotica undecimpunctata]|uniref:uncharacterized protein n=1 Tax=Diabrotica undecimpunctata TaxID=50387 RepID=UPI003B639F3B